MGKSEKAILIYVFPFVFIKRFSLNKLCAHSEGHRVNVLLIIGLDTQDQEPTSFSNSMSGMHHSIRLLYMIICNDHTVLDIFRSQCLPSYLR